MPALTETARAELTAAIERFIHDAAQPVVLDEGEHPLRLLQGQWSLSEWNGRTLFEAWDDRRNLARRITGLKEQRRDRLVLTTERFPKAAGELRIADLAAERGKKRRDDRRGWPSASAFTSCWRANFPNGAKQISPSKPIWKPAFRRFTCAPSFAPARAAWP